MPPGDLIVRNGQYEYNGLLINSDWLQAEKVQGLFTLPAFKTVGDSEMDESHGGRLGRDLLSMKEVVMELGVHADSLTLLRERIRIINDTFQPRAQELPLVYQQAGIGKLQIPCRPRKVGGFPSDYETATFQISRGAIMLLAPDPRALSMVDSAVAIGIASGATQGQSNVTMSGNFNGGAWPILKITGPALNPRITNNLLNRAIRIDVNVPAGSTLTIDVKKRTVDLDGVDKRAFVRSDNQWWVLARGTQQVTYNRADSPANTSTLTVTWKDSYVV